MKQRTIAKSIEIVGIGLHKGVPVKMRLEPLDSDMGIVFYRVDAAVTIPLKRENVVDTKMATVIGKDGVVISTIEHLLSAVYAYGIDNLRVVIDNDEVPVLDGSSAGYCMLIEEAGIKELDKSKKAIKIKKQVEVTTPEGKRVTLKPSDRIVYDFEITFDHPAIGKQNFHFDYSIAEYKENISRARTFGFLHEVQYLRSIGLAQGGSMENAIVLDQSKVLNPEGLRFDDEFVRHKILDAIGDMALLEYTLVGEYDAVAGYSKETGVGWLSAGTKDMAEFILNVAKTLKPPEQDDEVDPLEYYIYLAEDRVYRNMWTSVHGKWTNYTLEQLTMRIKVCNPILKYKEDGVTRFYHFKVHEIGPLNSAGFFKIGLQVDERIINKLKNPAINGKLKLGFSDLLLHGSNVEQEVKAAIRQRIVDEIETVRTGFKAIALAPGNSRH